MILLLLLLPPSSLLLLLLLLPLLLLLLLLYHLCVLKALEKAKEAGRLEKNLRQSRERAMSGSPGSTTDQPNFDLTYSVSHFSHLT